MSQMNPTLTPHSGRRSRPTWRAVLALALLVLAPLALAACTPAEEAGTVGDAPAVVDAPVDADTGADANTDADTGSDPAPEGQPVDADGGTGAGDPGPPPSAPTPSSFYDGRKGNEGMLMPLEGMIEGFKTLAIMRDTASMVKMARNPFGFGHYRSEWTQVELVDLARSLAENYMNNDAQIGFTSEEANLTAMLGGIDPTQMLGPDETVAQVLHSTGWGMDGLGEALMFFTVEENGGHRWSAMLFAPEGFTQP